VSSRYDALERLQKLRDGGALTDEEFQAEKRLLLGHGAPDLPEAAPADEGIEIVEAGAESHSRLPLYLLIAAGTLIVAVIAGLLLGRVVSGPGGEDRGQAVLPEENFAGDVNLVEAPPPADVRTLAPAEQLDRAFQAAFAARGAATLQVAAASPDGAGSAAEAVRYTPGKLVWAPFGPVLVSEGKVADAGHVSAGRIAVDYLKPAGDRFELVRAWPAAVAIGSSGQVAHWSVSTRFGDLPVIVSEGGGTWQGYSCSSAKLTELRPDGPVEIASVPLSYDDKGAQAEEGAGTAITGRIINVMRSVSFDVVYTGARSFSEHWARGANGGYAVAGGGSQMKTC
jgi:Short C-terminal domain